MLKVFAFILPSLSTNNAIKADGIIFNCFPLHDTTRHRRRNNLFNREALFECLLVSAT